MDCLKINNLKLASIDLDINMNVVSDVNNGSSIASVIEKRQDNYL